jgi:hypothetical protein
MESSNVCLPAARETLLKCFAMDKIQKDRKEFACITGQPLFIFINMRQREGFFISSDNGGAPIVTQGLGVGAEARGNPGAN